MLIHEQCEYSVCGEFYCLVTKDFFVVAGYFIIFLNVCPLLKAKIFKENDWKHLASASSQMACFE